MLNNTEHNSQIGALLETSDEQAVTQLNIAELPVANAPQFNPGGGAERSTRRERRYSQSTGAMGGTWRVSLW